MQCLTDLNFLLVVVESILKNSQSAVLYRHFRQSLEPAQQTILIVTALSYSKSLNSSLLEVMISSKNERVFIRDLSDLTLQIIFDAWWASMNEGSKRPIA
jgi:hypothetical protein